MCSAGSRAVVLEQGINGDMITLYDKGAHFPLLWTYLIPATLEGKATHNVQNAMFAAALAYALGKSLDDIRDGLRTFNTTFYQAPGRMNVFDEQPFKVILDYGHNAAAIGAVCQLVDRLEIGRPADRGARPRPATGATRMCWPLPMPPPIILITLSARPMQTGAAAVMTRCHT